MSEMLPCPFCGTSPDDEEHPAASLMDSGWQLECGKCHACWPRLSRQQADNMPNEDDLIAFLNQRAAPEESA